MDVSRKTEIKEIMRSCLGEECCAVRFDEIQEIGNNLRNEQDFLSLLNFLNALSNKDRLLIVMMLKEKGEMCVCELELLLDKSQPSISHHLRNLERIGLIRGWKKGKFTYYNLEEDVLTEYIELFNREFNIA